MENNEQMNLWDFINEHSGYLNKKSFIFRMKNPS